MLACWPIAIRCPRLRLGLWRSRPFGTNSTRAWDFGLVAGAGVALGAIALAIAGGLAVAVLGRRLAAAGVLSESERGERPFLGGLRELDHVDDQLFFEH